MSIGKRGCAPPLPLPTYTPYYSKLMVGYSNRGGTRLGRERTH